MVRPEMTRGGWSPEKDRTFFSHLLGRASTARGGSHSARVHGGKLAYGARAADVVGVELLARTEDGWLGGSEWVVAHFDVILGAADFLPRGQTALAH